MTRNQIGLVAEAAHEQGAARHPLYWLKANHLAVDVIYKLGLRPSDPETKALASMLVLRLLDWLQPLGVNENPTEDNIKVVLERLKNKSVTEG